MDKLLTYATVFYSLIVAYIQFVIMLIELKIMYAYCTEIIYTVYIQYVYTLHTHVSTSGTVIQYIGLHCFKWEFCVRFAQFLLHNVLTLA